MLRSSGLLPGPVRRIAALVLLTGWLVPLAVPHTAGDDPICVAGLAGEETPVRIEGPSVTDGPEHCPVCHLARSFRSTLAAGDRAALWLAACRTVAVSSDLSHRGPAVDRLPARAPPVLPAVL